MEDDSDEEEDIAPAAAWQIHPSEFCQKAFQGAKKELREIGGSIAERREIDLIGAAVSQCNDSLRSGDVRGLERAVQECRSAMGCRVDASTKLPEENPRKANLKMWRPSATSYHTPSTNFEAPSAPVKSSTAPAVEESTVAQEQAGDCHDDQEVSADRRVLLQQKATADEAVRRGAYDEALPAYELLLEDAQVAEDGDPRAAILCNAALCSLKMGPDQRSWAAIKEKLRKTIQFCDEALRLDSSLAKAHFRRGCALEGLERFPEAYRAYEKASCYSPGDARVREALERMLCYEESELGPDLFAELQERLERVEPQMRRLRRRGQLHRPKAPANKLEECCCCGGDGSVGNHFAVPCGHGPFCRDCRARITRQGRGLEFCAATTCGTIIEEWRCGQGELVNSTPKGGVGWDTVQKPKPMFGPKPPPTLALDASPIEEEAIVEAGTAGVEPSSRPDAAEASSSGAELVQRGVDGGAEGEGQIVGPVAEQQGGEGGAEGEGQIVGSTAALDALD